MVNKIFLILLIQLNVFPIYSFNVVLYNEMIFEGEVSLEPPYFELLPSNSVFANPGIITEISDASFSFNSAVSLGLDTECIETLQSSEDYDYYKFVSPYSNYFQFNIESNYETFSSTIYVYEGNNLTTLYDSYSNSIDGNLSNIPVFYAEKDQTYYFSYSNHNFEEPAPVNGTPATYTARLYDANVANIAPSLYDEFGYIYEKDINYGSSGVINVYFDNLDLTNYYDALLDAMRIWNNVGHVSFTEVFSRSAADVIVEKVNTNTMSAAQFASIPSTAEIVNQGRITLNGFHLDSYEYNKLVKTCAHELGHALGLGHINYAGSNNIMYYSEAYYPGKPGQGDIAVYRYLWGD